MNALPHLWLADGLRAITIALWGVLLAQSFWVCWYALRIRRIYSRIRRDLGAYRVLWWHVMVITGVFDAMATEISWKIIFRGVGKVGIAAWTYPNVVIYAGSVVALYLILQVQRRRYIKARVEQAKSRVAARSRRHDDD